MTLVLMSESGGHLPGACVVVARRASRRRCMGLRRTGQGDESGHRSRPHHLLPTSHRLSTTDFQRVATFLRGLCLVETDRMMRLPRPLDGKGVLALAIAALMSASTSGRARTSTESTRMKRVWFPDPSRIFWGSGRLAPWMKHKPTPLALPVNERMASKGLSVGP